jgi:transaldolase
VKPIAGLRTKIFADGANLAEIAALNEKPWIAGFTTNPTLVRKAGVTDYAGFARELLFHVREKPVSFEVLAETFEEMEWQAREIASWGPNVFVKIPVVDTAGRSSGPLVRRLSRRSIPINVTAATTIGHVSAACAALAGGGPGIVSVFAGRIADTGRDPVPLIRKGVRLARAAGVRILWASTREVWNVFQADGAGCDIVTVTTDLLRKFDWIGQDLEGVSVETVRMFCTDARAAALALAPPEAATAVVTSGGRFR